MQKITILLIALLAACITPSCLTSLHPLATNSSIIMDKRIEGKWTDGKKTFLIEPIISSKILNEDSTQKIEINKPEERFFARSYAVTLNQNGSDYIFLASLSKIDNMYFMDLTSFCRKDPAQKDVVGIGFQNMYDFTTTYSLAQLVFQSNGKLSLKFLAGDQIRNMIQQGNVRIKHEEDKLFGTFLITASSFELKQFLEKYGHDERIYKGTEELLLTRKL